MARWLRWFKAPVLSAGVSEVIHERATSLPVETLRAWLLDEVEVGGGARIGIKDMSGLALVRHYLWDFVPKSEEAALALTQLGVLPNEDFLALSKGAERVEHLLDASPVLLASLIYRGLGELFREADAKSLAPLCCKLRNQCSFGVDAGTDNTICQTAWSQKQESLLKAACSELGGVDPGYLSGDPLLKTAMSLLRDESTKDADREALRLSFFSGSYRRWLAATLLHDFYTVLISDEQHTTRRTSNEGPSSLPAGGLYRIRIISS